MEILNFIVGLFIIGIGFLIKSAPNLIAGYNTMSKNKKENVDIEGLSTFLSKGFKIIGVSIIIGYYFFKYIGCTIIANLIILIATLIGVAILFINAQKFDYNKNKKTKLPYLIFVLVFLFVIGLITYGVIPSKVSYGNDTIRFSGMYGFEVGINEIEDIELCETLPMIKIRTNGFSIGSVKKGNFNLDEFGKSKLLIHSDLAPYLIFSKHNETKIIVNFKNKVDTENTYNKIKTMMYN